MRMRQSATGRARLRLLGDTPSDRKKVPWATGELDRPRPLAYDTNVLVDSLVETDQPGLIAFAGATPTPMLSVSPTPEGGPHGSVAGLENGLVASTTNMTRARSSIEPLLETCIGVPGPWPAAALPAPIRFTPWGPRKVCSPAST